MTNVAVKILLVDDEPDILEFIEYNLKKEGYDVYLAKNGKEAIDIAKKERPQLIILDIMMPVMDGIEACRHIREIPELKDTLVTFLTARNEETTPAYGILNINLGTEMHLFKQPLKLRFSVQNLLNTKYFNHLSNWRRIGLPEPGRNFMLSLIFPLEIKI